MSSGRARVLGRVVLALAAAVLLLLGYGVAVEPRLLLDEQRVSVTLPGLDPSWEGRQVAVFSDLQVGMWWDNSGTVERVVDRVLELDPAAALLPGDFLYGRTPRVAEQVQEVVELLRPLAAAVPTFAVLGNHDHASGGAEEVAAALEGIGVTVLHNASAALAGPAGTAGRELHVVGLGPADPPLADAAAALETVPPGAPRLVMMNNPTSFPELPARTAPAALAGHTHCGQVALPGSPRWSYLGLSAEEALVADGWAPRGYGEPGNALFVTCGLGFSLLPLRIGAPPQLVVLELKAG